MFFLSQRLQDKIILHIKYKKKTKKWKYNHKKTSPPHTVISKRECLKLENGKLNTIENLCYSSPNKSCSLFIVEYHSIPNFKVYLGNKPFQPKFTGVTFRGSPNELSCSTITKQYMTN